MLKQAAIILCMLLIGCAAHHHNHAPVQPAGEYQWRNDQLFSQVGNGSISPEQVNHEFVIAKNTCKIEALKIPIPSPSCTQPPRQDCTGLTGFALGFCQGHKPKPQCDYSSVNAAYEAQSEIFDSCMILRGWTKTWVSSQSSVPASPEP